MTEVSNNVHSLWVQTQWGNPSRIEADKIGRFNNRYEKAFHNSFVKNISYPAEEDVFCKLVPLWQLQLYFADALGGKEIYMDMYERMRLSSDKSTPGAQQLDFVRLWCDLTGKDLTDFFRKWGFLSVFDAEVDDYGKSRVTITQNMIDDTLSKIKAKNYPVATDSFEYICDANWELFKNRRPVQKGTAVKNEKAITLNGWKNAVAYEVYEGESLAFVSNRASFELDYEPTANTKVYAVAFDGTKTKATF